MEPIVIVLCSAGGVFGTTPAPSAGGGFGFGAPVATTTAPAAASWYNVLSCSIL